MTGFGRSEVTVDGRRLLVELRAVNHRYLDVRVRLPSELVEHTPAAEAVAKARIGRGRVEINARLETGDVAFVPVLDVDRARAAFVALTNLRDELAPKEPVPLSLLATVPDLFRMRPNVDRQAGDAAVRRAVEAACTDLDDMRLREGKALAADFAQRIETLRAQVDAIAADAESTVNAQRERLRERVNKLLSEDHGLDPRRLEQEIAILADKGDVTEELTRLRSHLDQFGVLAAEVDTQVGRKLDFLVQELNREVNTIGSKCADAALSHVVVAMKAEIERIREQVQNVV
jgi:uncharacterized protein (TIGR00255 family)